MTSIPTEAQRPAQRRRKRTEDPRLLTGSGRFVDDVDLPGTVHMALLRSPYPHARITRLDVSGALALPGVVAAFTCMQVAALVPLLPILWRAGNPKSLLRPVMPPDQTVRYVGEPVAAVLAETRYLAEDALDAIEVEYEPLPTVPDVEAALLPDAPLLYPEWGTNVVGELVSGSDDADAAMAAATCVVRERFTIQRLAGSPLEARGALAQFDPFSGEMTLWASTQVASALRSIGADALGMPERALRVISPDVGGGFGNKDYPQAEEILTALFSREVRRPVKWIEDRREALLTMVQARGQTHDIEIGFDAEGHILAIRDDILVEVGGHLGSVGLGPALVTVGMVTGPYDVRHYAGRARGVVTNKAPFGAYRGYGMPEATFALERAIDQGARRLGLDPAVVRERNLIPTEAMPYATVTHQEYDSGDYPRAFQRALDAIGYADFRREQEQSRSRGRLLGIGAIPYVEFTGLGPSPGQGRSGNVMGGYEEALIRMDRRGGVAVYSGMASIGSGIKTSMAQVVADELGISPDWVTVILGDTAMCPVSPLGTVASRSAVVANAAARMAARKVRTKLILLGAHLLEADPEDLEIVAGRVHVRGAPARGLGVEEVAMAASQAFNLPPGMEPGIEEHAGYDPSHVAFSYGVHAAVVEIDPATGAVALQRYAVVHDCGPLVNPTIVEGQIHGGVAQGIGAALLEKLAFDENCQPLSTTFMDYLLPTAMDVPALEIEHMEVPSPHTPDGAKGCGESGTIPSTPAIVSAIEDALAPFGAVLRATPITPETVWSAMQAVAGGPEGADGSPAR